MLTTEERVISEEESELSRWNEKGDANIRKFDESEDGVLVFEGFGEMDKESYLIHKKHQQDHVILKRRFLNHTSKLSMFGDYAVLNFCLIRTLWRRNMLRFGIDKKITSSIKADFYDMLFEYIKEDATDYLKCVSPDRAMCWNGYRWIECDIINLKNGLIEACRFMLINNQLLYKEGDNLAEYILTRLYSYLPFRYNPDNKYLGFINGVLNLESKTLEPITPEITPRFSIEQEYDPTAKSEDFEKVLNEVLMPSQILVLQEGFGKCLTPAEELEKLVMLTGNGRNGKSTIIEGVKGALGKQNYSECRLCDIVGEKGSQLIAEMEGKLLNISNEGSNVKLGNEEKVKLIASGESTMCKHLYKQPYHTTNYPQSICLANYMPATKDFSEGFRRRFLIIDFAKDIPKESVDIKLKSKLRSKDNQQGIIMWILEGYWRLKEQGKFSDSPEVNTALENYKIESDSVAAFMADMGYKPSNKYKVEGTDLFKDYLAWVKEENNKYELSKKGFYKRLRQLSYKVQSENSAMRVYVERLKDLPDCDLPF